MRAKKLNRQLKQIRAHRKKFGPKFKFGVQVPFDWLKACKLQNKAGHTKWIAAEKLEMHQVLDYETFDDHGKGGKPPMPIKRVLNTKFKLRTKLPPSSPNLLKLPS